jgi:hypothetical protein
MKTQIRPLLAALLAPLLLGLTVAQAQQKTPAQKGKAPLPATVMVRVVDVFGRAGQKQSGRDEYSPLSLSGTLSPETMIRTGEGSAVLLLLPGGHYLRVGERTVIRLDEPGKGGKHAFRLLSGQAWAMARGGTTALEVRTPSAIARATNGLFGVGYELEADQSLVSVGDGSATVSLASGGWSGPAKAGQYVRYLRNPQPNIRLRSPEVLAQDAGQRAMWQTLRAEDWTKRQVPGDTIAKLKRGQEKQLRQLTFSVSVEN